MSHPAESLRMIEESMQHIDESMKNIHKLRELSGQLVDPDIAVTIFELLPDAIVVVDAEGVIQLVNRQTEFMFGYHRSELFDREVEILIPSVMREKHTNHRKKYMQEPRPRPMGLGMELNGQHKNGSEFLAEINLSPMATPHGIMVMAVIRKRRDQGS